MCHCPSFGQFTGATGSALARNTRFAVVYTEVIFPTAITLLKRDITEVYKISYKGSGSSRSYSIFTITITVTTATSTSLATVITASALLGGAALLLSEANGESLLFLTYSEIADEF